MLGFVVKIFQCSINNNINDFYNISSSNNAEKRNVAPTSQTIAA